MLTEKEKHGISELLGRMSPKDLSSLAQTVTSRLIVPETTADAVSAILLHTERPADLLRRRKVKKEFLFKYLHAKKVPIDPAADKSDFVNAVLQLWGSSTTVNCGFNSTITIHELDEDSLPEAPAPSRNTSYSSLVNLDYGGGGTGHHHLSQGLRHVINQKIDTESDDTENSLEMIDANADASVVPSITLTRSDSSPTTGGGASSTMLQPASNPPHPPPPATTTSNSNPASASEATEMAVSFVKWYYPLINSTLSESSNSKGADDFGPQHFWIDASAHVTLQAANNSGASEAAGVEDNGKMAAEMLRNVVMKHRVTHNPNITREGVNGVIDAHGLALVTACGTLHSGPRCCGTFHQQFGLVRDPAMGNNWKIKFTTATLVSKEGAELPRLSNAALLSLANSTSVSASTSSTSSPRDSPTNGGAMALS